MGHEPAVKLVAAASSNESGMGLPGARPYADPEKAARQILEIANAVEPVQGRIEKINEPFCSKTAPARPAGLKLAIECGWVRMHESGTFVTFTPAGAELFA